MREYERVLIQFAEAKRFADDDHEAYQRLALLLLDNIAEALMYRECEWLLFYDEMFRPFFDHMEVADSQLPDEIKEIRGRVINRKRAREIRYYFDPKIDYLVEKEKFDPAQGRAMKKLHAYRNEAHHRGAVRSETLATAVDLYFYLVCELFRALQPHSYVMTPEPPAILVELLGEVRDHLPIDFLKPVGERYLVERQLDEARVKGLLSRHLLARMERLLEDLENTVPSDTDLTFEQAFHHVQVPSEKIRTKEDLKNIDNFEVPYDMSSIEDWKARAQAVAEAPTALEAFTAFADIEDEFEPLEEQVEELVEAIDAEIQYQFDIARGK